jgi:spore germination protein YaaH
VPRISRIVAVVALLVLAGGGAAYAVRLNSPAAPPALLLDGVPLDSGSQEVPPRPTLKLGLAAQSSASDYRVTLDGRDVNVQADGAGSARLMLPLMPQMTWHNLAVWRSGFGGAHLQASSVAFRTAEPLKLAAAWLVGPGSTRVDVSWSRPLRDPSLLEVEMRGAGASVERTETAVVGRWPVARAGTRLGFSVPAGFSAANGSYLASTFSPALALPPQRPYSEVQLSNPAGSGTAGLRLQVYYVSTAIGLADLAAHARQISILTPNFYALEGDGRLVAQVDAQALAIARQAHVEVQPLVTNIDFDADKAHDVIASSSAADTAAANLVAEARQHGYAGYQLDFENLHAVDRDGFTRFSAALARRLGAAGLKYSAAVIPRKGSGSGGILSILPQSSGVYDYPALSRDSGWLTLMAYDQHTNGTPPGPVAALDWVRQVVQGTSGGLDHSRLFLGIPLYYRDWAVGSGPGVGPYSEALQLAIDNGAGVEWDFAAGTAFVRYRLSGVEHILWMDNRASLAEKVALAHEMGFGGVSAWRLGFEDPGFWELWPAR